MLNQCTRRCFLQTAGGAVCFGALFPWADSLAATDLAATLGPKSKIRIGKVYVGRERAGWPTPLQDLKADIRRFETVLATMPGLADVEFVDGGLLSDPKQVPAVREKFKEVTGILALHLSVGTGPLMAALMESQLPMMIFTLPYSGHEWHIVASWQREGKLVDVLPSSRYADIAEAVRPFRAIQRMREARILHVSQNEANADYVKAAKAKFGAEIISIKLPELQQAYHNANRAEAEADATRWLREAKKIVEPTREDVVKGSLMYVAMKDLLVQYKAHAITMNCLGMGLIDKGMGYPCLGFVRLNNALLAGVCEADLKSTLTQLIFTWLVGRTGFVTDPVFDLSNSTIIHAHCVAATQMEGPWSRPSPYHIRTHLEDNRGVSLQVKMPIGRKVSMARLIGMENMLFSTGDAVDTPFVERGCRSKLTMRVANIERFLADWSSGLHRVIFYGDHTRDLTRYCRFMRIKLLREGIDDLQNVPGLDWEARVKA